jgi:hypothetical protein
MAEPSLHQETAPTGRYSAPTDTTEVVTTACSEADTALNPHPPHSPELSKLNPQPTLQNNDNSSDLGAEAKPPPRCAPNPRLRV